MSRTYHKILRLNNCCGSNTEYYKYKRRQFRHKSKQDLNTQQDDFVNPEQLSHFKDSWLEPTDGSFLVDKNDVERIFSNSRWYNKLINKFKK